MSANLETHSCFHIFQAPRPSQMKSLEIPGTTEELGDVYVSCSEDAQRMLRHLLTGPRELLSQYMCSRISMQLK